MNKDLKQRKITFPINVKLSLSVLFVVALTLGSYVYLAVDMFKTDKVAYVFEAVGSHGEQVGGGLKSYFEEIEQFHDYLSELSSYSKVINKIFSKRGDILGYYEYRNNILDKKYIVESSDRELNLKKILEEKSEERFLFDSEQKDYFIHRNMRGELQTFLIIKTQKLNELLPENELYDQFLVINNKYLNNSYSKPLFENDISEKFFQTSIVDDDIVSITPVVNPEVGLVTVTSYQKAILAARQLQEKSIYYGGLVAGLIILFILIISGLITKPIIKLHEASSQLAQANFSFRVRLKEKDELGVLGDSFNFMAEKIEGFIEQMKEKVRLENEIKTAQLVQQSFFPHQNIRGRFISLSSYFKSASECGGDWWGYLNINGRDIVLLIDVTGHGTAPALLTAMIHNSITALKYIAEKDPSFGKSSSQIMEYLNDSFCSVNIDLNATSFVAVINEETINYCNASHLPPFLIRKKSGEYSKSDFLPLIENLSERLGENKYSKYISNEVPYSDGDHLIIFTDGILEATNDSNKPFGQRNFIKSIIENLERNESDLIQNVVSRFYSFLESSIPDDDITLLNICLGKRKVYINKEVKEEILEKVENKLCELDCISVNDIADASTIIYDGTIRDLFLEDLDKEHIKTYISAQDFLTKQEPFELRIIDVISKSTKVFKNEETSEIINILESAINEVVENDSFNDVSRYLKLVSLELVQNALLYGKLNKRAMDVFYSVESTTESYLISIKDQFGKLDWSTFLNKVQRSFTENTYEEKDTGAGLGLSMVLDSVDEIHVYRKDNEFTEIKCIINKHKRLKEFKSKNISLLFKEA